MRRRRAGHAPGSVGPTQEAGSTRSCSPGTAAPKGSTDKSTTDKGTADKGSTDKKATDKGTTESGDKPAPPPSSQPQRPTGPVRFGKVATTPSDNTVQTDLSPDRRAFSTAFSDFEVIANPASAEPSASKSFAMTLPLTDGAEGDVLGFHVSGWAATTDGATARMTLRGGGKVKVRDIPTDADFRSSSRCGCRRPRVPPTGCRSSSRSTRTPPAGGTATSTPKTSRSGSADPGRRIGAQGQVSRPGPYAPQACGPRPARHRATAVDRVAAGAHRPT